MSYPDFTSGWRPAAYHVNYRWADYLELLCLASKDHELSASDAQDRFLSPETDDLIDPEGNDDSETSLDGLSLDGKQAKWEKRLSDYYNICKHRAAFYKDRYPFEVSSDFIKCRDGFSREQQVYLFLLFCSNLPVLSRSDRTFFTSSFERIAKAALEKVIPSSSICKAFGKGSEAIPAYAGQIFDKITKLAEDLGCSVKAKKSDYASTDTGDTGLDLVAFQKFGDAANRFPLIFCQCTCEADWFHKQCESSFNSWKSKIDIWQTFLNFVFIPHCYRNASGDWHAESEIYQDVVLFDRFRILNYCIHDHSLPRELKSYDRFSQLLEIRSAD